MMDKHAALYDVFCKSRAQLRAAADPEDESRRQEFMEAGLKGATALVVSESTNKNT